MYKTERGIFMQMYGYGCIVCKKEKTPERPMEFVRLREMFLPEDNIIIEVVNNPNGERPILTDLIERCRKFEDIIVIRDLKTLGTKRKITYWYEKIFNSGVGILIPDYDQENKLSEFSTVGWDGNFIVSSNEYRVLLDKLRELKYSNEKEGKGRLKKTVDAKFISVYWAWQNYYIDTNKAIILSGLSRQSFYNLAKQYEETDDYNDELQKQPQDFGIKPKRGTLPDCFRNICFKVENLNIPLNEVCDDINMIDYQRMKTAYLNGKKGMAEAQKKYLQEDFKL